MRLIRWTAKPAEPRHALARLPAVLRVDNVNHIFLPARAPFQFEYVLLPEAGEQAGRAFAQPRTRRFYSFSPLALAVYVSPTGQAALEPYMPLTSDALYERYGAVIDWDALEDAPRLASVEELKRLLQRGEANPTVKVNARRLHTIAYRSEKYRRRALDEVERVLEEMRKRAPDENVHNYAALAQAIHEALKQELKQRARRGQRRARG